MLWRHFIGVVLDKQSYHNLTSVCPQHDSKFEFKATLGGVWGILNSFQTNTLTNLSMSKEKQDRA